MCDLFDRSSSTLVDDNNAIGQHSSDMPDMDELLDQLERDSSHQFGSEGQKLPPSEDIRSIPSRHPVPKPRRSVPILLPNELSPQMSNPNKILMDKPKAEEEEREEEEEMIVKSMLDERGEELVEVERLEMLEKEEEAEGQGEEEEQKATKTTEKHRNEQMDNGNTEGEQEKPLKGILHKSKREDVEEAEKVEHDDDQDIFAQIDMMDAQIRAEEDHIIETEGKQTSATPGNDISADNGEIQQVSDQFYTPQPCSSSSITATDNILEQFVEKIVADVICQVLTEQLHLCFPPGEDVHEGPANREGIGVEENKIMTEHLAKEQKQRKMEEANEQVDHRELQPSSSSSPSSHRSPLATVHDLSVTLDEFKLTESELMLGKKKPYWIPDEDCPSCMLCSVRFSLVNRRHHCRACGRVLCRSCCSQRRQLTYMEERDGKQRVCSPCNRTLDRIDEYEQRIAADRQADGEADPNVAGLDDELNQLLAMDSGASQTEQKSTRRPSMDNPNILAASSSQSVSANRPKKSLLKQPGAGGRRPSVPTDPSSTLAMPESDSANDGSQPVGMPTSKRSVTFRDGVNPGQDSRPNSTTHNGQNANTQSVASPSPYQWLIRGGHSAVEVNSNNASSIAANNGDSSGRKLPRKLSRRSKERRIEEEAQMLTAHQSDRIWVAERRSDGVDELVRTDLAELVHAVLVDGGREGAAVRIALRRNFHLRIERTKVHEHAVLSICTQGLAAIGVDELLLLLQFDSAYFPKDLKIEMLALLEQFDQIFQHCLDPQEDATFDHQMGIRKCVGRMTRLYALPKKKTSLFGHKATSILFHRPLGQSFAGLHTPNGPFLVGVLVRQEEQPWAMCVPSRLLLRLGMLRGEYPFPVVNVHREQPVFTASAVQSSVLKVLNDFRHWSYRMARLSGTAVAIRDNSTEVVLSNWLLDELRPLVESNRNMIGWALSELSPGESDLEIDSHLVCVQEGDGPTCFSTRIFTPGSDTTVPRKATGASFVILDGALKGGEQLLVSLIEDGVVIRLHADLMEELVKALLEGDSFSATSAQGHRLTVYFRSNSNDKTPNKTPNTGALVSPIDARPLAGYYQYGLVLTRQLRSLNFFQFSSEWALRLSAVINLLPGKFPSALQPRFFEVCEQLAAQVAPTLEPFLHELIAANQRSITLRVHVEEETISYETERWPALPEQHFAWTVTLDEQIIPFLYALCAWVPNGFFVELQMPIVSTRPLPALTVPADA